MNAYIGLLYIYMRRFLKIDDTFDDTAQAKAPLQLQTR